MAIPAPLCPRVENPSTVTVAEVLSRYLIHSIAVGLHCAQAIEERRALFAKLAVDLGQLPIGEARQYHLSDWIESHPGWRSTSTRKAKANQINAAMNWAKRTGRIAANPWAGVNYAEAEPRPCLEDDCFELIATLANKAFERAARFLRLTGCRLSDLFRMTWEDIDFERGLVILANHKAKKKTGKPKVIVLTLEAVDVLVEVHATHRTGTGFVFLNSRGKPWTRRTLGQQFRRLKLKHGIDTAATLHGIRHQAATVAIRNGAPLKFVAEMLGHSSTAITEKYYVDVSGDVELTRQAAELAARRKSAIG